MIQSLSVLLGGVITWLVADHYYRRAGNELRDESAELRRLVTLILKSLEAGEIAKLTRDASGRITGFVIQMSGTARATPARTLGNLAVKPREGPASTTGE